MPDVGTVALDGQKAALAMLRRLLQMNEYREHRRRSAALLAKTLDALPEVQRMQFLGVVADWLVADLIGCGYEVDDYENLLRRRTAKRRVREAKRRDPGFQQFLSTVQGTSAPLAT